jgi:hypothetical protein
MRVRLISQQEKPVFDTGAYTKVKGASSMVPDHVTARHDETLPRDFLIDARCGIWIAAIYSS